MKAGKLTLSLTMFLLLLLSACGRSDDAPPVVEIGTQSVGTVSTVRVSLNATVTNNMLGVTSQSPSGLIASFRVRGNKADTRVDIPGNMFEDGKARFALYNVSTGKTRVFLTSTSNPDPSLAGVNFDGISVASGLSQAFMVTDQPFMSITTSQFTSAAQANQATVSDTSSSEIPSQTAGAGGTTTNGAGTDTTVAAAIPKKATRTITVNGAAVTQVLYFDPNIGAVSRIDTTIVNADQTETSSARMLYTTISGITGGIVPYDVNTTLTITPKVAQPPMIFPPTDKILTSDAPVLTSGQFVAQQFTTPDPLIISRQKITQRTRYTSIAVNTLPDSYFEVGQ